LVYFSEDCKDQTLFCDALSKQEGILSCVSTESLEDDFSSAFMLINMVVYIVIIMAACLAFVVLFTLATTNISERTRELATIKVLGFYDNEVHSYVNKETMILTGIGILLGIPLGYAFAQTLTQILSLPSMYLAVSLHPISYFIAGGLSLVFALIVNVITDKSLDQIDPVEALKSVE
jgi:putative ABC transport system permease protein